MKSFGLIACSFLVAGCLPMGGFRITQTDTPDSFAISIVTDGNCGASGLQGLLNQNESVLEGVSLPEGTRVIHTGTVITHDVVGSRLNIGVAADGTIVQVACG